MTLSVGKPFQHLREDGFTLVEMMVALLILAIVLTALAPAFYGSLRATASANARSVANGLAVAANEQIRSLPYYQVGYGDSTKIPSTCSPGVVSLPNPGPMDALPSTRTVGLNTYTLTRCVYWQSATITADTGAYKRSVVTVGWKFNGAPYSVSQTSAVYPGGETSYAQGGPNNNYFPAGTTTTTAPGPPSPPSSVSNCTIPPATPTTPCVQSTTTNSITLAWTPPTGSPVPVDHYSVQLTSNYPGSGPVDCLSCAYTYVTTPNASVTISGLTPGTTYWLQVRSIASDGTPSVPTSPTSATTVAASTSGCQVYSLFTNPTQGVVDSNGHLVNATAFSLWVNATTPCSLQQLRVAYVTSGSTTQYASVTEQGNGGYLGTAGTSSSVWTVGNHQFTVWLGSAPYSPLVQGQANICLQQGTTGKC